MVGPFALDGYDVLAPLDAAGRSWRAVCLADGVRVVLRRCVGGAAQVAEARRCAAVWGSLAGGGVVDVRDVVVHGDDLVVVSDVAAGGGLDALVARRGALTPGQAVTLIAPLAQTLADAHDRGLVHGRIALSNIVLDDDGRPLLTDWSLARDAEASADVAALAALALRCVGDDAPESLLSLLRSARDLRTLAEELLAAVPAEPLLEPPPSFRDEAVPVGRLEAGRSVVPAVGIVVLAVVIAVAGGILWGRGDSAGGGAPLPPQLMPSVSPTRATPDWHTVVRALERQRVRALAEADRRLLAAAELRGTALWRRDVYDLSQLTAAGARLSGVHVTVSSVRIRSVQPRRVVVRVVDALSSYDVIDKHGAVIAHHSNRASRTTNLVLTRRGDRWVLAAVSRRWR